MAVAGNKQQKLALFQCFSPRGSATVITGKHRAAAGGGRTYRLPESSWAMVDGVVRMRQGGPELLDAEVLEFGAAFTSPLKRRTAGGRRGRGGRTWRKLEEQRGR